MKRFRNKSSLSIVCVIILTLLWFHIDYLLLAPVLITCLVLWIQHTAIFRSLSVASWSHISHGASWWSFFLYDFWRIRSVCWRCVAHWRIRYLYIISRMSLMLLEYLMTRYLPWHHSLLLTAWHVIYSHHFGLQALVYNVMILWNAHAAMEISTLLNKTSTRPYVTRSFLFVCNFPRAWSYWSAALGLLYKCFVLGHSHVTHYIVIHTSLERIHSRAIIINHAISMRLARETVCIVPTVSAHTYAVWLLSLFDKVVVLGVEATWLIHLSRRWMSWLLFLIGGWNLFVSINTVHVLGNNLILTSQTLLLLLLLWRHSTTSTSNMSTILLSVICFLAVLLPVESVLMWATNTHLTPTHILRILIKAFIAIPSFLIQRRLLLLLTQIHSLLLCRLSRLCIWFTQTICWLTSDAWLKENTLLIWIWSIGVLWIVTEWTASVLTSTARSDCVIVFCI